MEHTDKTDGLEAEETRNLVSRWTALWNGALDVADAIISPDNRVHAALVDGGDGSAANGVSGMKGLVSLRVVDGQIQRVAAAPGGVDDDVHAGDGVGQGARVVPQVGIVTPTAPSSTLASSGSDLSAPTQLRPTPRGTAERPVHPHDTGDHS